MNIPRFAALFGLALLPVAAHAHPGHGGLVAGLAHPFSGLDHTATLFAVGLLAAYQPDSRARAVLPAGFILAAAAGAALGFAGWALPGCECMIAASVLALGLALAVRDIPVGLSLLFAMVLPWGLFHGNAHALESSGQAAWFTAGFLLGMLLLTAAGFALGRGLKQGAVRALGAGIAALGGWLMLGTLA